MSGNRRGGWGAHASSNPVKLDEDWDAPQESDVPFCVDMRQEMWLCIPSNPSTQRSIAHILGNGCNAIFHGNANCCTLLFEAAIRPTDHILAYCPHQPCAHWASVPTKMRFHGQGCSTKTGRTQDHPKESMHCHAGRLASGVLVDYEDSCGVCLGDKWRVCNLSMMSLQKPCLHALPHGVKHEVVTCTTQNTMQSTASSGPMPHRPSTKSLGQDNRP